MFRNTYVKPDSAHFLLALHTLHFIMNKLCIILLFFTAFLTFNTVTAQQGIDKNTFYIAMSSANAGQIDAQLQALKNYTGIDKQAFEGAMQMRKAATLSTPAKKLSMFKEGHKKLEAAISKNPANVEYRFLRLMIQENAPRALGYYRNIDQDSKLIKDYYKSLNSATQQSIAGYSKKSKALSGVF